VEGRSTGGYKGRVLHVPRTGDGDSRSHQAHLQQQRRCTAMAQALSALAWGGVLREVPMCQPSLGLSIYPEPFQPCSCPKW
jgi:hypothetical protein